MLAVLASQFHRDIRKVQCSPPSQRIVAQHIPIELDGLVDKGGKLADDDVDLVNAGGLVFLSVLQS